jgi:hypothetical protein
MLLRKHLKSCTYLVLPFHKMSADFHLYTYPLALPISQHIFDYAQPQNGIFWLPILESLPLTNKTQISVM